MVDIIGGDVLSALQPAHHVIHLVGFEIVLVIEAWSRALRRSECSASRKICASDRLADAVAGVTGGPAVEHAAKPIRTIAPNTPLMAGSVDPFSVG
jgi:hypothetical protein